MGERKASYQELEKQISDLQAQNEELRLVSQNLQDGELKFRALYENSFDAILLTSPDGGILSANEAACTLFQRTEEEICEGGRALLVDTTDPRLREAVEVREKSSIFNGELTCIRKNGEKFEAEVSSKIYTNYQGNKRTSMIIRDISERKKIEQIIRESEVKLRTIFNVLPIGISLISEDHSIIQMNSNLEQIIDLTYEELLAGKHKNRKYFHANGDIMQAHEFASSRAITENKLIQDIETGIQLEDGSMIWTRVSAAPIKVGNIAAVVTTKEISAIKQKERELIRAKEKAEINEVRLIEAQSATKVGSWETDLNNLNVIWSEETYKIFGLDPHNFEASHPAFLGFVHPEDKEKVNEAFIQSFNTNHYNSVEHRIITQKHEIRHVEERWRIIKDDLGNPIKAIGTCQDITEHKIIEEELLRNKEKAEESDRLKSAFLANMSHEVRTPMNAIIGFSSFLKEEDLSPEKRNNYVDIITKSGKHLLDLINDIIDISIIEAGQVKVVNSDFNINELLNELYELFRSQISAKKKSRVELIMSLPSSQLYISSDQTRLKQILINLIGNAIKFTDQGSIEFGYKIKDNMLEFFVKDTGIGIPEDKQQIIFDRFQQAAETTNKFYGGTGLGLSIARACTRLLNGEIWLESTPAVGTTFYFTIEFIKGHEKAITKVAHPVKQSFNNELILIAEDDDYNYFYFESLLSQYNLRLIRSESGRETIQKALENDEIKLILMDIQMPDLSGEDATLEIKRLKPDLPIIAQTAYAMDGDRDKYIDLGCDDYVAKPISKNNLLRILHKFL